jgi:hypothetical protein
MTTPLARLVAVCLIVTFSALPAKAQGIPVFDVSNFGELIDIVRRVKATFDLAKEEIETVKRLAQGKGGYLGVYRVPAIPTANHDVSRYLYGGELLDGFNTGDPRGERYTRVMRRVMRPGTLFDSLPTEARRILESTFATLEIYDSTSVLGVHQAATSRAYSTQIDELIRLLEADVTSPGSQFHETTAIADNLAVAGLIGARQGQNTAMTLSSTLEVLIAKNKRSRDAAAAHMNTVVATMEDGGRLGSTLVEGSEQTLRNWSLP